MIASLALLCAGLVPSGTKASPSEDWRGPEATVLEWVGEVSGPNDPKFDFTAETIEDPSDTLLRDAGVAEISYLNMSNARVEAGLATARDDAGQILAQLAAVRSGKVFVLSGTFRVDGQYETAQLVNFGRWTLLDTWSPELLDFAFGLTAEHPQSELDGDDLRCAANIVVGGSACAGTAAALAKCFAGGWIGVACGAAVGIVCAAAFAIALDECTSEPEPQ